MNTFLTAAAAALSLTAGAALADQITLGTDSAGATLHDRAVDMSVYWTQGTTGYDVVAIYSVAHAPAQNARLNMTLNDGDKVTFGLPGLHDHKFTFAREGVDVSVQSDRVGVQVASN